MSGLRTYVERYQLVASDVGKRPQAYGGDYARTLISSAAGSGRRSTAPQVKGWKRLKAQGKDVTTSLSGVRYMLRKGLYRMHWAQTNVPNMFGHTAGNLFTPAIPSDVAIGSLQATATGLAQIAFASKVRKATQSWAGGVFVGELRETSRMLATPVNGMIDKTTTLAKDILSIKRRALRMSKRQIAGAVSDSWLLYQFGMAPLISDANDAANALERLAQGNNRDVLRITATGTKESYRVEADTALTTFPGSFNPGVVRAAAATDWRSEVTYRGVVASRNPSGDMPIPMQFGVDLSSIAPTAWELIPWSFLMDYFTNIGDALDAWSIRFIDFAWINRTVRNYRRERWENLRPVSQPDRYFSLQTIRPACSIAKEVIRGTADTSFAPAPMIKIPGFGSIKYVNMAALYNSIRLIRQ